MTDQVPSGDSAAQAADNSAPATSAETASAQSAAGTAQPFGTFGTTRGSGLARGKKRPLPAETSAASTAPGGYQPTALEVIVPQREYKNPFDDTAPSAVSSVEAPSAKTDPTPPAEQPIAVKVEPAVQSEAAVQPEPARTPVREPRPYVAPVAHAAPVRSEPPAQAPQVSSGDLFPLESSKDDSVAAQPKAELNILPPAETRRSAMSWEKNPPAPKGPAPVYPPRQPRDDRREERRDERPTFRTDAQRSRDQQRSAAPESARKPGGFFAWLKGLFGGKPAVAEAPSRGPESQSRGEFRGGHSDGQHDGQRRRRHRGGRGRNRGEGGGGPRTDGPRSEGHSGAEGAQPHGSGGEHRGEPRGESRGEFRGGHSDGQHDGQRRRRHRGGRGRNRGEGGGGPRSEGQQGGGFI